MSDLVNRENWSIKLVIVCTFMLILNHFFKERFLLIFIGRV